MPERRLTNWLNTTSPFCFACYAMAASFSTYFCMYAFRKPFAAGMYASTETIFGELDFKTAYVISQIVGYATSKFIGIRVCSEVSDRRRAALLIGLIIWAESALLLFAYLPPKMRVVAMFLNGLPLGMVWGLVVRYLEGRQLSELLLAGLSCSYILSSGIVKDIGRAWMSKGIPEVWMPAVTGFTFLPIFLLAVWMLNQLPRPTDADMASRVERPVMRGSDRRAFFGQFWIGLVMLLSAYFLFTAYRDYRDNYGIEMFESLGYANVRAIFTKTEVPVAIGVMTALAAINLVRNHRNGLIVTFGVMLFGLSLMIGGTLALDAGWLKGHEVWWMVMNGLGAYLAYVPFGTALFERLIASTRAKGNAVFSIYLSDTVGYTGSITIQLYKNLAFKKPDDLANSSVETANAAISHFDFFHGLTYVVAIVGILMVVASCVYFLPKTQITNEPTST